MLVPNYLAGIGLTYYLFYYICRAFVSFIYDCPEYAVYGFFDDYIINVW